MFRVVPVCDSTFTCQENRCKWISINITAIWKSHGTRRYDYINILHTFIATAFFKVFDPESQWKSKSKFEATWGWGSINRNWF